MGYNDTYTQPSRETQEKKERSIKKDCTIIRANTHTSGGAQCLYNTDFERGEMLESFPSESEGKVYRLRTIDWRKWQTCLGLLLFRWHFLKSKIFPFLKFFFTLLYRWEIPR